MKEEGKQTWQHWQVQPGRNHLSNRLWATKHVWGHGSMGGLLSSSISGNLSQIRYWKKMRKRKKEKEEKRKTKIKWKRLGRWRRKDWSGVRETDIDEWTDGRTDKQSTTTKTSIITGKHSLQPWGPVQSDGINSEARVQNEKSVNTGKAPTEVDTQGAAGCMSKLKGRRPWNQPQWERVPRLWLCFFFLFFSPPPMHWIVYM